MNIGYKKLQNNYIAELEILGKTNENRNDIANPQYAKYRTSKVRVLKIFHMNCEVNNETQVNDETQIIEQMNSLYDINFIYVVGKEMHVSNYNENVNEVCSKGIHYFKTPYQAKMWDFFPITQHNYTGKWTMWWENGNKRQEGEYKDGKEEGKWIGWYESGTTKYEGEYKDGQFEGKWIGWRDCGGNKTGEGGYKDGKLEGKCTKWYISGTKEYEGEYKDGKKEGKWTWWWEDGNKQREVEYKDGKEEGKWTE